MYASLPRGIQSLGLTNIGLCIICVSRLPDVETYVGMSQVDVQLKKRKVGVAIVGLLVALVLDVLLEDGGGLWVVSVKSVEDGFDVLWALWRIVEWDTHDCDLPG